MTVTPEKIALGVCDVTFDGTDLGSTKGGVDVEIKTESYEVKVDQAGSSPVKEIVTGTTVTVKVPMAETDLTRLKAMMPQSVATAGAAAPTGRAVNLLAGYAVGAQTIAIDGAGGGAVTVGQTFSFAGHATVYRVTAYAAPALSFAQAATGAGGLVAPVDDDEALSFAALTAGVEIRTGVNLDLLDFAKLLKLHPTGVDVAVTTQDFTVFKAGPSPNFSFKYATESERVYEVTFKGYPDVNSNNRLAAFGAVV